MIDILGARVLQSACNTAAAWRGSEAERLTVSVKVSALQINGKFFRNSGRNSRDFGSAGLAAGIGTCRNRNPRERRARGPVVSSNGRSGAWRIAVNHAGTNYSSLSYLSRLPVDRLKLDKS